MSGLERRAGQFRGRFWGLWSWRTRASHLTAAANGCDVAGRSDFCFIIDGVDYGGGYRCEEDGIVSFVLPVTTLVGIKSSESHVIF